MLKGKKFDAFALKRDEGFFFSILTRTSRETTRVYMPR